MAMGGAAVARPLSPSGALFVNPAGLVGFSTTTLTGSLGVCGGTEKVTASVPAGYAPDHDVIAFMPEMGVSIAGSGGWRYGLGVSGSIGMNYDFPADPALGIDSEFFSEFTAVEFPLALAYEASDRLWLGVEPLPLFGYLRNHYVLGGEPFSYKLTGPGVQAMAGATWLATETTSVGLSVRSPGRIWMEGSDVVTGVGRQDVDLHLDMPMQVNLGVEQTIGQRWRVGAVMRWSDTSSFGESIIKFERTPAADTPFIPDANDEWRVTVGLTYAWSENLELRAGVGRANHIVGNRGVSPMIFDNDDVRIASGIGYDLGDWRLDLSAGLMPHASRVINASDALVLPGRYSTGGYFVMIGFERSI